MKIGVITDAHANLPALEAALAAMAADGCDRIVHTGDAIGIGPHPREVLTLLQQTDKLEMVMGNHDELYATELTDTVPAWMSPGEWAHQRWTHWQLGPDLREWVATWPWFIDHRFSNATIRFQHYGRTGNRFAPISTENLPSELDRAFQPTSDLVFFGHHHPPADVCGKARYINPGALGCKVQNGARYAVLEIDDTGSANVELKSTPYDTRLVLKDMLDKEVPEAEFILKTFLS